MAETAFQTMYRQEFIRGFEDRQSRLRTACVTDGIEKGNVFTFLISDSGSATANTRGVNGLLTARANSLTQTACTLREWHDLARITDFNVFASQGNQRAILQSEGMSVVNRKIDDDIIAELDTATVDTGNSVTASLNLVVKSKVILGNAYVPTEEADNMFSVVSPAFMGYLHTVTEFASADFVDVKPMTGPTRKYLRWMGVNWIEHPRLTGAGTSTEKCYMFHRTAIGHAMASGSLDSPIGYDSEHAYSWARVSGTFGSKLLQNSGIVQMKHDGSAFVGA